MTIIPLKFEPCTIDTLRACFLCAFSSGAEREETARCWHPDITSGRGPAICTEARSDWLLCGPDATLWSSRNDFEVRNRTIGRGAARD